MVAVITKTLECSNATKTANSASDTVSADVTKINKTTTTEMTETTVTVTDMTEMATTNITNWVAATDETTKTVVSDRTGSINEQSLKQ